LHVSLLAYLSFENPLMSSTRGFKFAEMELKQVLATLLLSFHFSPSEKPVEWKMAGLQSPVVPAPQGDGITPQMPLTLRRVVEDDFKFTA
jgi:hypothetical protein